MRTLLLSTSLLMLLLALQELLSEVDEVILQAFHSRQ